MEQPQEQPKKHRGGFNTMTPERLREVSLMGAAKGGSVKVPKGFAKMSKERHSELAKLANAKSVEARRRNKALREANKSNQGDTTNDN